MRGRLRGGFGIIRGRRGKTVGLVKTRRLAAMHPPSPRLRRTGKQQRAKAGKKVVKPCSKFQGSSFEAGLKIRLRENGGR